MCRISASGRVPRCIASSRGTPTRGPPPKNGLPSLNAQLFKEDKSLVKWEPWQLDAKLLPNTVYGADHQTGWGLACWKCGHAKVSSEQIAQIKNTAVWTNTHQLFGVKVDPKEDYNRYKRCNTFKVRCARCEASIGSLYEAPYFDGCTGQLTTKTMFPCVKVITVWSMKETGRQRHATVTTGDSKFVVEDILATIAQSDESRYIAGDRIDSTLKKAVLQAKAHEKLAATKMREVAQAAKDAQQKLARVEAWRQKRAQSGQLRACCICDDEVPVEEGVSCGGWVETEPQVPAQDVPQPAASGGCAAAGAAPKPGPTVLCHFTCDDCLESHTMTEVQREEHGDGYIYCPGRSESSEGSRCFTDRLTNKMLAMHCSEATFEAYQKSILALREKRLATEMEMSFADRVKQEAAKLAKLSKLQKKVGLVVWWWFGFQPTLLRCFVFSAFVVFVCAPCHNINNAT